MLDQHRNVAVSNIPSTSNKGIRFTPPDLNREKQEIPSFRSDTQAQNSENCERNNIIIVDHIPNATYGVHQLIEDFERSQLLLLCTEHLFISLIHQQSYQTVAAKGIQHADGKARPTGTYSFPDKTKHKNEHLLYSLQTTTTGK